jgi:aspartyl-tRNA(Asn)/glutamyl-tRNA(Gln) amidotransferase subunit A
VTTDLLDLDLRTAAQLLASGELDPVILARAYLDRIEVTGSRLNEWVTVDPDGALAAAERARTELRSGHRRGPLHGIPVGVKDLFDTAGLFTSYGSPRFADHVPDADAAMVSLLRAAGAVVLGKQSTHEFAWGGRTDSAFFGPTRNPHDPARIPGGSSGGGGASVAARSSLLALGTDTAGSVRIPAALCGCVGLKPTFGRLPVTGAYPLAPSLDHAGLLARTVDDVALAFEALAAPATRVPDATAVVALVTGPSLEVLDDDVRAAVLAARDRLGRSGVEVREVRLDGLDERVLAILELVRAEAQEVHGETYAAQPDRYGADLAELLDLGPVGPDERAAARSVVRRAVTELEAALAGVDALLTATVPVVAPPIGATSVLVAGRELPVELALTRLTSVANAAGVPALSVPAPDAGPLPVGLQLIGPADGEAALLRLGRLLG